MVLAPWKSIKHCNERRKLANDPFWEFTTLKDRMNRLFRDSFGSEGRDEALTSTGFATPADVWDDHSELMFFIPFSCTWPYNL